MVRRVLVWIFVEECCCYFLRCRYWGGVGLGVLGVMIQEFRFGFVILEMFIRYLGRGVQWVSEGMCLEFRGEVQVGDLNVRVISMQMDGIYSYENG